MTDYDTLATHYFAGELDAAGVDRLGHWIAKSPENARQFALAALITRSLNNLPAGSMGNVASEAERSLNPPPYAASGLRLESGRATSPPRAAARFRLSPLPRVLAGVAAALLAVAAPMVMLRSGAGPATLVASVSAEWHGGAIPSERLAKNQALRLDAGLVQLRMASGAAIVVEGPAEFSAAGPNSIHLSSGKLAALCRGKQSHGFVVSTTAGRVVDLGTEFGVEQRSGMTFVHVLEGEVQLFPVGAKARDGGVLREGEVSAFSDIADATAEVRNWSPNFCTAGDFRVAAAHRDGSAPETWRGIYADLRSDPDLVFWSDFNLAEALGLPENLSRYGDGRTRLLNPDDIADVGAGRVATNEALQCRGDSSAPIVRVPGVFRGLTLAAWVRLDDVAGNQATEHRGLLLSDWSLPGSVHWQVKRDELRLSYPIAGAGGQAVHSAPLRQAVGSGSWRLFTTVVQSGPRGEVRHYLDGELAGRSETRDAIPLLRLGDCGVGGWRKEGDGRPLQGLIDDLLVWRRPLSTAEVRRLWKEGRAPADSL